MGTTSAEVANTVLESLTDAGIKLAFLHGEGDLADGKVPGDLDLVVDRPAAAVVARSAASLQAHGLHPVVLWIQDIGGGGCLFCCTEDATDGVQIDLLYDADGVGKYGLRSPAALDSAECGVNWPRLEPTAELLYLLSKRHFKGDGARLAPLIDDARSMSRPDLESAAVRLFSKPVADLLLGSVNGAGGPMARPSLRSPSLQVGRWVKRLSQPSGFWVEVTEPELATAEGMASAIANRFGRFLPHAVSVARQVSPGRLAGVKWWAEKVAATRYRPGLVVSWSGLSPWPRADLVLDTGDSREDELSRRIVAAMARRLVTQ